MKWTLAHAVEALGAYTVMRRSPVTSWRVKMIVSALPKT
jgi:hypothetical protein